MDLNIKKVKKNPVIIAAFPGFGLVGVIATEFLIEHLDTEIIGKHWFESQPATTAVHEGKLIYPLSVHYNKKHNIIIVHSIGSGKRLDWEASNIVLEVAKKTRASEIIMLEGVGSMSSEVSDKRNVFYHVQDLKKAKALDKIKITVLREGIIMGATSAVMLKSDKAIALFVESSNGLPDSKGAARLVEVLDAYLNLKVDYAPLNEMAKKLEGKLKAILEQSKAVKKQEDEKLMSYVG